MAGQKTVAYVSTSVAFGMFVVALLYHIYFRLSQLQCARKATQFLKSRLQCSRLNVNDGLKTSLIDDTEMCDKVNTPTTTVVGLSPQHSDRGENADSENLTEVEN